MKLKYNCRTTIGRPLASQENKIIVHLALCIEEVVTYRFMDYTFPMFFHKYIPETSAKTTNMSHNVKYV